jgi:hypothetical protein
LSKRKTIELFKPEANDFDTEFPMSLKNGSSHRGSLPLTDWHWKQPIAEHPEIAIYKRWKRDLICTTVA